MAPEGEAARLAKRPTAFMHLTGLPVARFEALGHVPNKLLDFFDQDMLQFFEFELRPYRSNDSI
jgi:hypothetical protein